MKERMGRNSMVKILIVGATVLVVIAVAGLAYGIALDGESGGGATAKVGDALQVEVVDGEAGEVVHQDSDDGHQDADFAHAEGDADDHRTSVGEGANVDGEEAHVADLMEITLYTVEGRPWRFEPAILEVPVGHTVELTLVNDGRAEHDVEIHGMPFEPGEVDDSENEHPRLSGGHHDQDVVAAHAEPGTTAIVVFTPTQVGEFDFECTIPGHKEAGMVGKLVVTP